MSPKTIARKETRINTQLEEANEEIVTQHAFPSVEQVQALAYMLWEERGRPEGSPELDWFEAERRLSELDGLAQTQEIEGERIIDLEPGQPDYRVLIGRR